MKKTFNVTGDMMTPACPTRMRFLLCVAALLVATGAIASGESCPVDQSAVSFTGETRVDPVSGKLLKKYRCSRGHVFWSVG